jgi:hypothetical protein
MHPAQNAWSAPIEPNTKQTASRWLRERDEMRAAAHAAAAAALLLLHAACTACCLQLLLLR